MIYFFLFLKTLFFVVLFYPPVLASPSITNILEGYVQVYQFALNWVTDFYKYILSFFAFIGVVSFWLKSYR